MHHTIMPEGTSEPSIWSRHSHHHARWNTGAHPRELLQVIICQLFNSIHGTVWGSLLVNERSNFLRLSTPAKASQILGVVKLADA